MAKRRNDGTIPDSPDTSDFIKLNGGRWVDGVWHWNDEWLKKFNEEVDASLARPFYDRKEQDDNPKNKPLLKTPEY